MADQTRSYEIRVSAVLDRSTAAAAGDFVQQFTRAHRASGRSQVSEAERAQRNVNAIRDRYFAQQQRQEEQVAKRAASQSEQAAKRQAASQEQAQRYVSRIRDRYFSEQQRQEDRALAEKERSAVRSAERTARAEVRASAKALEERKAQVRQIAGDSISNAAAIANKALGVGKEIAGGMGVDFSIGSGIAKHVRLQKMAIAISNASNRGDGQTQDPHELEDISAKLGEKYKIDPEKAMAGMGKFQALTGDLKTAKALMESMTRLGKAFSTDLDDMVGAAGQVGSAIGEVGEDFATPEEKAKELDRVMRGATAQGQEGAIEVANLTSQYAKLKGAGVRFEGKTGDNILKMSALAQMSYQMGGAGSVSQATNSVMAFVNTLSTSARRKEFKAAGVEIDSNEAGKFVDPYEIIKRSLKATGGDTDKMKAMFANVLGEKAINALSAAYRKAGGGDKGLDAIDKQYNRFNGTVTDKQINENLAREMGSIDSKAQGFQNKLDAIAASLAERVLPAFERLAPTVEKVMTAFADVVSWSANNPGQAITLAIIGSIGKATLGPMIAKAITDKISGGMGGVGQSFDPERRIGPGKGVMAGTSGSLLGSATMIGAIAVTTFTVGSMIVDKMIDDKSQAETGTINDDLKAMGTDTEIKIMGKLLALAEKTDASNPEGKKTIEETLAKLQEKKRAADVDVAQLKERIANAKDEQRQVIGGSLGAMLRAGENYVNPWSDGPNYKQMEQAQNDIPQLAALEAQLAAQKESLSDIATRTLTIKGVVEVSNMQPGMGSSSGGREGVPDHS